MISYKSLSVLPLLRKNSFVDQWFPVSYSVNFNNGCPLSCIFCPVNFEEDKVIINKKNIFEELARECRNIPFASFVGIGGGYNEIFSEKKNIRTENLIKLLLNHKHKLLFLTHTANFKNYFHLFENKKNKPIVIVTINCFDEKTNSILSPDSSTILEKIQLIQQCKKKEIPVGIFYSPIIIGINDQLEMIKKILRIFHNEQIDFFYFDFADHKTLTKIQQKILKFDKQKRIVNEKYTSLNKEFEDEKKYQYFLKIKTKKIIKEIQKQNVMPRIPLHFLKDRLSNKNFVIVLLKQLYFFLKYSGEVKNFFIYNAHQIEKLTEEQFDSCINQKDFRKYFKISYFLQKKIIEIVDGDFSYYYQVIRNFFISKNI